MTFEITLNQTHYKRCVSLMVRGAYDGKNTIANQAVLNWTVMALFAIVMFLAGALAPWDTVQIALRGCAIGFCLGWLASFTTNKILIRNYASKFTPAEDDPLFHKTTYTLDDQNIRWQTNSGEGAYVAKQLHKLADDEQVLLLFKSNREAFIFPKDQLNEEQVDFIRNWASTHI